VKISTPLSPLNHIQLATHIRSDERVYKHVDVRAVGCKQLLTGLGGKARIDGGEDNITNRDVTSALMLLDKRGQAVLLNMSGSVPRREEAHLAEVAVVGEIDFGP
jgi:hypothetical protein